MRATAIAFRLRMAIMVTLVVLGFWAPWVEALDLGRRISLLEWLALEISRGGLLSFYYATPVVIVVASIIAAAGMVLRVWGTAYLGYATVHHGEMQAATIMADGPYRFVRNPLYVGGWCMFAAMAFVMPPTGALVAMPLLTLFLFRLILGEEAFLSSQLSDSYQQYSRAVPRLIPRFRGAPPAAGDKPHWLTSVLTELNPIGIFITVAVLSWRYDNQLMLEGILVSFGIALLVRGFMHAPIPTCIFIVATCMVRWLLHAPFHEPFHQPWANSALIGLGVALVSRALLPPRQAEPNTA